MDSGEKWKIFNDPAKRVTKCRETLVSSSLRYRGSDKKPNREFSTRIRIEAKSTRIVRKMDIEVSFVFFFFLLFCFTQLWEISSKRIYHLLFRGSSIYRDVTVDRSFDRCVDFYYKKCQHEAISFMTFPKACNWWRGALRIEALLLSRGDIDWYRVFLHVTRIETFLFIARAKSEIYTYFNGFSISGHFEEKEGNNFRW